MAHDVFVSYSQKDKPVADAVVAGLEQGGIRCWIAPRDIRPGSSWGEAIVDAIEKSRFMVIILSKDANRSRQVVREVERAVSSNVIIIPFRIDAVDPTGAMSYFLSTEHWLDALTPPLETHIQTLEETIRMFQDGTYRPEGGARPPLAPAVRRKKRKQALLALGGVLVLGLAVAGIVFLVKEQARHELIPTGAYQLSGNTAGLFLASPERIYVAGASEGILALDISDPAAPKVLSVLQGQDLVDLTIADGHIFFLRGDYARGLGTVPEDQASGELPDAAMDLMPEAAAGSLYHLAYSDGLLHLAGHNYWGIWDLSQADAPRAVFEWTPPGNSGNPCNVLVAGDLAYVTAGWEGLYLFDLSDPENPVELSRFDTPDWAIDLALSGETLLLSLGEGGVMSVDVSDPARPVALDTLEIPGFASALACADDWAYVLFSAEGETGMTGGLAAVDLSDAADLAAGPVLEGLNGGIDLDAEGEFIYVTDETKGLQIIRME